MEDDREHSPDCSTNRTMGALSHTTIASRDLSAGQADKTRAKKDILKLMKILKEFKSMGLGEKYPEVLKWSENYLFDSKYFFNNKDYFSAFGSANYAFGIIDGILIINGKKRDEQ